MSSKSETGNVRSLHRPRRGRRRAFVVFTGGLGNQLFEFAAAASVAGVKGVRLIEARPTSQLDLEILIPGLVRRCGNLDQWLLGTKFAGTKSWRGLIHKVCAPLRSRVARRTLRPGGDLEHAFDPRHTRGAKPLVLDGFFQHPDWFEPAKAEIVDRLISVAPAWLNDGLCFGGEEVVVAVRGCDYVELGWHLGLDYYERAMRVFGRPSVFRVVTDDRSRGDEVADALVRQGWTQSIAVSKPSAIDDFWVIAGAQRVVMANSTFCWWATSVGDRLFGADFPDRVVVFPEHWVIGYGWVLAQPWWRLVKSGNSFVGR